MPLPDGVTAPEMRDDILLTDEVTITLPAWLWLVFAHEQAKSQNEGTSTMPGHAIASAVNEALMTPLYIAARKAEYDINKEQNENAQKEMARRLGLPPGFPFMFGQDGEGE